MIELIQLYLIGYGPRATQSQTMDCNFSLDAIKHGKRFDGTQFQNWKHSMELMFEFKDVKEIVEVSGSDNVAHSFQLNQFLYCISGN